MAETGPASALWTVPSILLASLLIAWAAESAQFFIAQGFALAILAWMQTLPEFAVEAVLAWHRMLPYLLANLTGALRLLTGIGWPMIYVTAAVFHRKRFGKPLRRIRLEEDHAVQVIGLLVPQFYIAFIWWKGSLSVWDAIVLIAIYASYLFILQRMPPENPESIDELERVPRAIVLSSRPVRIAAITLLFIGGGALIYFVAEPFLGSLFAISSAIGLPSFVFIQWVAPFVSEFPEMASTFYWARTVDRASMSLMNMVSSNINQWTLLTAMLPIVYSISMGGLAVIPLDPQQRLELLMTLGQSIVGLFFLMNMELAWWEALVLFALFIVQFALSIVPPGPGFWGTLSANIHWQTTVAYFAWAAVELLRMLAGWRKPLALVQFGKMWKAHVRRR
jgi:cation:H+ antiporter